jgi:hypothetical protein
MIFTPEVVDQIAAHMNGDHADDNVLICRAFGKEPAISAARMSGMDADGMDFVALIPGVPEAPAVSGAPGVPAAPDVPGPSVVEVRIRVPFSARLTERRQVRAEAVRMYREACAELGLTPSH